MTGWRDRHVGNDTDTQAASSPVVQDDVVPARTRWHKRWTIVSRPAIALGALAWAMAALMPHADVLLYAHYASLALRSPALHLLPKEYPGPSIGLFLLPKLLPLPYVLGFSVLAELALFSLLVSSDGLPELPRWNRRVIVYLALGTSAVLVARYDIVPAMAVLLAVERARTGRWSRSWTWAVFGGLLKLFPLLLLPGFLIAERRSTGRWALRRVGATVAVFAATAATQILRSPASLFTPFSYEFHRGFEIESFPSSLTLLASPFHVHWIFAYGAIETVGPLHGVIGASLDVLIVTGLGSIWWLASRGRLHIEAVSLAVLSVAVLGDKAFSAQYLIWLIPLWAYWELRLGWIIAACLTTVVYPFLYFEANVFGPDHYVPTAVAGLRNVVLLVSTLLWLREQLAATRGAASISDSLSTIGPRATRATRAPLAPQAPQARRGPALFGATRNARRKRNSRLGSSAEPSERHHG